MTSTPFDPITGDVLLDQEAATHPDYHGALEALRQQHDGSAQDDRMTRALDLGLYGGLSGPGEFPLHPEADDPRHLYLQTFAMSRLLDGDSLPQVIRYVAEMGYHDGAIAGYIGGYDRGIQEAADKA